MLIRTIPSPIPAPATSSETETGGAGIHHIVVPAAPLITREAFAPFGDVIANPRPDRRPSCNTSTEDLPCGAVAANQGTAIQYRRIATTSTPLDLYSSASSGRAATARTTMFVCAARTLVSVPGSKTEVRRGKGKGAKEEDDELRDSIELQVLERHPFTSQTFIPLTADTSKRYLVIVAPTLRPATAEDEKLPVPTFSPSPSSSSSSSPSSSLESGSGRTGTGTGIGVKQPGPGMPDLANLKAFIVTGEQAVTYAAGTWHAPMIALGPSESTIDFVVVQFANDVPVEDCQEVALENSGAGAARIFVRVPVEQQQEQQEQQKRTNLVISKL